MGAGESRGDAGKPSLYSLSLSDGSTVDTREFSVEGTDAVHDFMVNNDRELGLWMAQNKNLYPPELETLLKESHFTFEPLQLSEHDIDPNSKGKRLPEKLQAHLRTTDYGDVEWSVCLGLKKSGGELWRVQEISVRPINAMVAQVHGALEKLKGTKRGRPQTLVGVVARISEYKVDEYNAEELTVKWLTEANESAMQIQVVGKKQLTTFGFSYKYTIDLNYFFYHFVPLKSTPMWKQGSVEAKAVYYQNIARDMAQTLRSSIEKHNLKSKYQLRLGASDQELLSVVSGVNRREITEETIKLLEAMCDRVSVQMFRRTCIEKLQETPVDDPMYAPYSDMKDYFKRTPAPSFDEVNQKLGEYPQKIQWGFEDLKPTITNPIILGYSGPVMVKQPEGEQYTVPNVAMYTVCAIAQELKASLIVLSDAWSSPYHTLEQYNSHIRVFASDLKGYAVDALKKVQPEGSLKAYATKALRMLRQPVDNTRKRKREPEEEAILSPKEALCEKLFRKWAGRRRYGSSQRNYVKLLERAIQKDVNGSYYGIVWGFKRYPGGLYIKVEDLVRECGSPMHLDSETYGNFGCKNIASN